MSEISGALGRIGQKTAAIDRSVSRHVLVITESTGLAGSSRGSWSFVPIVICSCQRLLQ
jgi:hypothetical protein